MRGLNPSSVKLSQATRLRWVRDVRFESRAIDNMIDSPKISSFLRDAGKGLAIGAPPASPMGHRENNFLHPDILNDWSDVMSWIPPPSSAGRRTRPSEKEKLSACSEPDDGNCITCSSSSRDEELTYSLASAGQLLNIFDSNVPVRRDTSILRPTTFLKDLRFSRSAHEMCDASPIRRNSTSPRFCKAKAPAYPPTTKEFPW